MPKLKFDLINPNFDAYFLNQVRVLTEEQIAAIPQELQLKLFRKGGEINEKNTSKLSFLEKLYVLSNSKKKKWNIVIEDEQGIEPSNYKAVAKKNEITISQSEKLSLEGAFILGNKELADTFHYLNNLNVSPAYSHAIKAKNSNTNYKEFKDAVAYFSQLLMFYEGNKKKMVMQKKIKIPEWYILLYFYDGNKKKGSDIYNFKFKYSFNSSKSQIIHGITNLHRLGYLTKYGELRHASYSITALGKELVNDIFSKFIFSV